MKNRKPSVAAPPAAEQSKLSGARAISIDYDEHPSREDKSYGETIFTRPPVPLPRFLTGRRRRKRPS